MLVQDLNMMEKIVANNRELKWDGWDVLELKKTNIARTDVNGVRINNQWFIKTAFVPNRMGWEIPSKYKV